MFPDKGDFDYVARILREKRDDLARIALACDPDGRAITQAKARSITLVLEHLQRVTTTNPLE